MLANPSAPAYSREPGGDSHLRTDSTDTDTLVTVPLRSSSSYTLEMPEVLYKTPEAMAFQKYGVYEVSEFTGSPSIQVPLYTVKYKDIEIPIALTYDAGGIPVEQESSWVGLGWNLMVGGCINYVPSGSTDPRLLEASATEWEDFLSEGDGVVSYMQSDMDSYSIDLRRDFRAGYGERDYYQVSLPHGRFLTFFYDNLTGKYDVFGKDGDQYKIEDLNNSSYSTLYDAQWAVTDGDGWVYYFQPGEKYTEDTPASLYTSSWNLVRILSPEGSAVDLGHARPSDLIHSRSRLYEQYDCVSESDVSHYPALGYSSGHSTRECDVSPTYPSYIDTYDQHVAFTTSTRDDYPGSRKLDRIAVISKLTGDTIREILLSYDYFRAPQSGGNHLTYSSYTGGRDDLELRLKLLSVKEVAGNDTLTTRFSYNETERLPIKTSYAQDFWGYYNGRANSGTSISQASYTMLPTPLPILLSAGESFNEELMRMKAANRYCDPVKSQAAMLTGITYPSKGSTRFEYEAHRFSSTGTMSSLRLPTAQGYESHNVSLPASDNNQPGDVTYRLFTVGSRAVGTVTVSFSGRLSHLLTSGACVRIYPHAPGGSTLTYDLASLPGTDLGTTYSYTETFNVDLSPNTYTLVAYCPDDLGSGYHVTATMKLHQRMTQSSVPENHGGGLRIRKVTNIDETGMVCDSTVYEYVDEGGATSGRLLQPLTFFDNKTLWCIYSTGILPGQVQGYKYSVHRLRHPSCSMPVPLMSMSGGAVGYSTVTRKKYDSGGALLGSVVSCYTDSVPKSHHGMWYFNCHGNGSLLSRTFMDSSGHPLRRLDYTYEHTTSLIHSNVMVEDTYVDFSSNTGSFQTLIPRYRLWFYSFVRDWDRLASETETLYGGESASSRSTFYTYSSNNHRVRSSTTDSSIPGMSYVTEYKYPFDFASGAEAAMADSSNFIINPVVEQSLYGKRGGNTTLLQSRRDRYSYFPGYSRDIQRKVYLRTTSSISSGGGAPEQRISYTYSPLCDLRYVEKDSTERAVYLWGYHQMYPVAEIRGATYAQVSQWATPSLITQLGNAVSGVPSKLSALRSALSDKGVLVTTSTFEPLLGPSSTTSPNGTARNYTYDVFGRLSSVSDGLGNTIETHQYHFKP